MSAPPIGRMRHRVSLQQAVRVSDGGGGATMTWSPITDLWAAIAPLGGDERVDADGLQGRSTHEVWVRYSTAVAPQMRFMCGTRVFDIRSVIDADEAHRFQRCLVEERLP